MLPNSVTRGLAILTAVLQVLLRVEPITAQFTAARLLDAQVSAGGDFQSQGIANLQLTFKDLPETPVSDTSVGLSEPAAPQRLNLVAQTIPTLLGSTSGTTHVSTLVPPMEVTRTFVTRKYVTAGSPEPSLVGPWTSDLRPISTATAPSMGFTSGQRFHSETSGSVRISRAETANKTWSIPSGHLTIPPRLTQPLLVISTTMPGISSSCPSSTTITVQPTYTTVVFASIQKSLHPTSALLVSQSAHSNSTGVTSFTGGSQRLGTHILGILALSVFLCSAHLG